MPSILSDLVKSSRATIEMGGRAYELRGLNSAMLDEILQRFPQAEKLLSGGVAEATADGEGLLRRFAPFSAVFPAIIAAGLGAFGDVDAEADAADLPLTWQIAFVTPILRLTFAEAPVSPFDDSAGASLSGATMAETVEPVPLRDKDAA